MNRMPSEALGDAIDWPRVDQAMAFLGSLDIIELANHIINQALIKGPKEAHNEAGSARYQLAKARQHLEYLQSTVCRDSLETQQQQIRTLEKTNKKKQQLLNLPTSGWERIVPQYKSTIEE